MKPPRRNEKEKREVVAAMDWIAGAGVALNGESEDAPPGATSKRRSAEPSPETQPVSRAMPGFLTQKELHVQTSPHVCYRQRMSLLFLGGFVVSPRDLLFPHSME